MAKTLRHAIPGGFIYINNDAIESQYPFSWWITQEPAYTYPVDAVYVQYTESGTSGQSYYLDEQGNQHVLPLDPWPAADIYISKQSIYDIAYADYLNTPTTLQEAKEQKVVQLQSKMTETRSGKVIYSTNTFESKLTHYTRLSEELAYATYLTDVPIGYYVNDATTPIPVQISFSFIDLKALVAGMEKLYYECFLNYDVHYAAIQALTTIPDVQAYDITTGWPSVPFAI